MIYLGLDGLLVKMIFLWSLEELINTETQISPMLYGTIH